MSKGDQYARQAERWSDDQYADASAYLRHRAHVVTQLGPTLQPGEEVLDLACGDGAFGEHLRLLGLRYRGIDATPEMVAAARARLGPAAEIEHGDLNDYVPSAPVAATTVFRAIYYARDRRAFFEHASSYTERKLVFDLNPRQYRVDDVRTDLHAAGFANVALRPFFVPQTRALPLPAMLLLRAAERSGPLAGLVLRARFTYVVVAWRG